MQGSVTPALQLTSSPVEARCEKVSAHAELSEFSQVEADRLKGGSAPGSGSMNKIT